MQIQATATLARPATRITLAVALMCALLAGFAAPRVAEAAAPSLHGLHVSGNQFRNGEGEVVRLRGVNRSGFEYACVQGWGFTDGAVDAASVQAMLTWNINSVRVPLNEGCWLGINTPNPAWSGANYRAAVTNYVNLLTDAGIAVTLDLHWAAPGNETPSEQRPMPNRDHSPAFWNSVATAYKDNDLVLFDLYNEPYPDNNQNTAEAWRCWRDGGTCAGVYYTAAGMQELINAVRATGAENVILLSGVQYAGGLDRWLEYKPGDPLNNLVASWHIYEFSWHNAEPEYWDNVIGTIMDEVPVVMGEVGQTNCGVDFFNRILDWLDERQASYNAWVWTVWGQCQSLAANYDGTPTSPYGAAYRARLDTSTNTAPSVTVPRVTIAKSVVADANLVRLRIAWGGSDDDGISSYVLQQRKGSGAWTPVTLSSPTATSHTAIVAKGSTWRFRVRATDTLGATSAFRTVGPVTAQLRQEHYPQIIWTGTWIRESLASASGGTLRHASSDTARATIPFQGTSVAWIARTGPDRGKAAVYIDGDYRTTVDLYRATPGARTVAFTANGLSDGNHTLEIRVLATKHSSSTGTRVDLDAIITLR